MLSLPAVLRPAIVVLCGLWWIYFTIGAHLESLQTPGQLWLLNIWYGSLGGNAGSAFSGTVLGLYLTKEVIYMVFTLLSNRRRVLYAAPKAASAAFRNSTSSLRWRRGS